MNLEKNSSVLVAKRFKAQANKKMIKNKGFYFMQKWTFDNNVLQVLFFAQR